MAEGAVRRRRRPATTVETGIRMVRRTYYGEEHAPEEENDTVQVGTFDTEPARVRVHGSVTRNMGDFNSVRVEVMLELPCLPEMSEIERAHGIASGWVEARIEHELNAAIGRDQQDGGSGNTETVTANEEGRRQEQAGIQPQGRRLAI